jgi:hypothetical protein
MKKAFFAACFFVVIFNGCTSGVRFYVCPHELALEMKSKTNMGQKKEVLAHQDFRVIVVKIDKDGEISVVQHYRPEHTFSDRVHHRSVSYDDPLTLTALIIVDEISTTDGIAIKKLNDSDWRIYWLKDSDIKELKETGVVYLPPYDDLPLLKI